MILTTVEDDTSTSAYLAIYTMTTSIIVPPPDRGSVCLYTVVIQQINELQIMAVFQKPIELPTYQTTFWTSLAGFKLGHGSTFDV